MDENRGSNDTLSQLEDLLEILELLARRIDRLEQLIKSMKSPYYSDQNLLFNFLSFLKAPSLIVFQSLLRAWMVLTRIGRTDPITESIIYVLSDCREKSISEVYRGVKQLRGKASRRIVARKIRLLEASGVVVNKGSEKRPRYTLRECRE